MNSARHTINYKARASGSRGQRGSQTDDGGPAPSADREPYPRIEPGIYEAECLKGNIFFDRQFGRWICALEFSLLDGGTHIYCFLNLGNKTKPYAGPRSEYRRAWIIANGQQPQRRQVLCPGKFKGRIFSIRIEDVTKRYDGREHPNGGIYSIVREIVRRTYP